MAIDQVIDHNDEDKLNNSVDNLEWVTIGENSRRAMTTAPPPPPYAYVNVGQVAAPRVPFAVPPLPSQRPVVRQLQRLLVPHGRLGLH